MHRAYYRAKFLFFTAVLILCAAHTLLEMVSGNDSGAFSSMVMTVLALAMTWATHAQAEHHS